MYVSCYKADETNFDHNGEFKILVDEEENNIYKSLNNQFFATFNVSLKDQFVELVIPRMIVKLPTPNKKNPMQLFRILDYEENDDNSITFTAFHIAWDLSTGFLPHINIVGKTRKEAAEYILEKAKESQNHNFKIIDIENPSDLKNLQVVRYTPLFALAGKEDNTLINRFDGAEIDFDNFDIHISDKIGEDTGFLVKDNKNINTSNKNIDFKPLATRIIPQGANELLLPEYFIDSPKIKDYDQIFYKHVVFNEIGINEEEGITKEIACEMLRAATKALFEKNKIDEPVLSWTINFDDMQDNKKVPESLKKLLKLDIGDSVLVTKFKLANKLKSRILEYNYNFVKKKYKDITISSKENTFTTSIDKNIADIQFKVNKFTSVVMDLSGNLYSKIEQTEKDLLLEVTNVENRVNNYIKITEEGIKQEVSKKTDAGQVSSIIQHDPYSVNIGFNGINDVIKMIPQGLRVNHGNSYSLLSGNGLYRYDGGTGREYHHLLHIIGFTTTGDINSLQWIQLPEIFKGKNFGAYATLSDTWDDSWDWGEPWVIQRMVVIAKELDKANARVGVQGYRIDKNYKTDARRSKPIAGMLFILA